MLKHFTSAAHHPIHLTPQIYNLVLKSGFSFSKSDDLLGSHHLLDMPLTDISTWNALISRYTRTGHIEITFQLFHHLQLHGPKPDIFTFSSLLKASSFCGIQETQLVHGATIKSGFASGVFVISGLLDNYSKAGDLDSAEKCFEEYCDCSVLDIVVWTTMLSGYVRNGEYRVAREFFMEMWDLGLSLNQFSLTSVLAALADGGCDVRQGQQIHCFGVKMGFLFGVSTPLSNALFSMYCRCGAMSDGVRAFSEIQEPDVVSWTALLGASEGKEALELFRFFCSRDMEINEYTMINVLSAIDSHGLLKTGRQIQAKCFKSGFLYMMSSVGNVLISMYGNCRQIVDAKRVFDEMFERDCVSWNALIAAYGENGLPDSALGLFSQMQHASLEPNISTMASLFKVVSSSATLEHATQIHSYIIKLGYISDDSMATTLITVYGKCSKIRESTQVFDEISRREVVHINAMAATLVQAGYYADALKLLKNSQNVGMEVDNITFSLVLKACSALTSIEQGRNIHSLAIKQGIDQDNFVGSAIVDIYCKCGSLDDAVKAFEEQPKDNLATWNAMITGYAQHGYYNKVIELFKNISEAGIDPDEITFLGVLYSCCHAGHLKEAYYYLNSMSEDHGIVPSLEHYACIVDLLGRVGKLEEAKRTIDQIPLGPDARIWQIFLTACDLHGNVELGEVAAQELLKLEPGNESAYVLLSKIYAAAGMWDGVRKIRKGMKERTVFKEPGCSWIQVRGIVHSFFANDMSHSQILDIYLKLEELNQQMMALQLVGDTGLIHEQYSSTG